MPLPDFIIVGAMKAGTTTLADYLRHHSEIYMPEEELHFFDARGGYTDRWERGVKWYEKQFESADPSDICGEKTPTYSCLPSVPERIYQVVPDVKIIWILRNPVDRSYSNYWHAVRAGAEKLSFEEAVKQEDERIKENIWKGYVRRSHYINQIDRFLEYFDRESMHFCLFANMKNNLVSLINEVTVFLGAGDGGVDPQATEKKENMTVLPYSVFVRRAARKMKEKLPLIGSVVARVESRLNRRLQPGYPEMSSKLRKSLNQHFNPYNRQLEQKVGIDLSVWKSKKTS